VPVNVSLLDEALADFPHLHGPQASVDPVEGSVRDALGVFGNSGPYDITAGGELSSPQVCQQGQGGGPPRRSQGLGVGEVFGGDGDRGDGATVDGKQSGHFEDCFGLALHGGPGGIRAGGSQGLGLEALFEVPFQRQHGVRQIEGGDSLGAIVKGAWAMTAPQAFSI
jgi:hypothetical protein